MVQYRYVFLCMAFLAGSVQLLANNSIKPEDTIEQLFEQLAMAISEIQQEYTKNTFILQSRLQSLNKALHTSRSIDEQVSLLVEKDSLTTHLKLQRQMAYADIAKVRYIKGLQIIGLLYEKTLSLDHHFASVHTMRDIHNMSNPNQYPEFTEIKQQIAYSKDRKTGFDLSSILGENIYTSVIHSMVSLFVNPNADRTEKEKNLTEVECIIDFTLRMHNDLNTIYFETLFLQNGNQDIKSDLEALFVSYTKPVGYTKSLEDCREQDDWDTVTSHLQKYIDTLTAAVEAKVAEDEIRLQQINLQFPIDRLLQFIIQYNAFIEQGEKFYEKFWIMLDSYENKTQCSEKIPSEYIEMKDQINIAISKFNTAYKPIGINGSKLKQLLYGINEYQ